MAGSDLPTAPPETSDSRVTSADPCGHERLEDEEGMKEETKEGDTDTLQHEPAQAWGYPDCVRKQPGQQPALGQGMLGMLKSSPLPQLLGAGFLLFLTTAQTHKRFCAGL